jgi:hypothetical protein
LRLLRRRSVQGILVVATAFAILGCCCPSLPLPLTRVVAQPDEAAPVQVIAGHAVMR